MNPKRLRILIQLGILAVTTLIAVMIVISSFNYKYKLDTIKLFKTCKSANFHYIDRIFINDSNLCLNCINGAESVTICET